MISDETDRMLAKHYEFTDPASRGYAVASAELDFIFNYDPAADGTGIKYRIGIGDGEDEKNSESC